MKVGIGIFTSPEAGGAYQYTRAVIQAASVLMKDGVAGSEKNHEKFDFICYSLDEMWAPVCAQIGVPFKHLTETKVQKAIYHCGYLMGQIGSYYSNANNSKLYSAHPLWKAYDEDELDVMFITTPSWYGKPEGKKLVMPIYDLMHRYLDFPEIGEGKTGEERDRRYASICRGADAILADSKLGVMHIIECYGDVYDGLIRKTYSLPFIVPDYIPVVELESNDESDQTKSDEKKDRGKKAANGKNVNLGPGRSVPEKYILYPAQFWKHKNHARLLTAAGELKEQGMLVNLVFTGSAKNAAEEIENTIEKYGLADQVTNLGYVTDEELVCLYQNARAMMFPAFTGPTSIPPLEAMALGCPVAVANNFAMPEQIDGAGLTFDPTSVTDIKDAMRRLWSDDNLCEKITERELIRSREWTVKEFAAELGKILLEINQH